MSPKMNFLYIFFTIKRRERTANPQKYCVLMQVKKFLFAQTCNNIGKNGPKTNHLSFSGNLFIKFFFFFALSKTANITQFCKKICNYPVKLGLNPCIFSGFIRFWCSEKHEYWVVQLNFIQCISTKNSNCTIFKCIQTYSIFYITRI